jgi:hypothetical protein
MKKPKNITREWAVKHLRVGEGTKWDTGISSFFINSKKAWSNVEKIKERFNYKYDLFALMEDTEDVAELRNFAEEVKENELVIQKLFHFKSDTNYFRFWEMPKCKCPWMDNQERWGTDYHIYRLDCPIHGIGTI